MEGLEVFTLTIALLGLLLEIGSEWRFNAGVQGYSFARLRILSVRCLIRDQKYWTATTYGLQRSAVGSPCTVSPG